MTPKRIAYFPFDAANFVGNEGQLPRAITAQSVPGWKGNGMRVSAASEVLTYEWLRQDGSPNYSARQGSVRMWLKPEWNSPQMTGYYSRLFDLGFFSVAQSAFHFDAVQPTMNLFQDDGYGHSHWVTVPLASHPMISGVWRQFVGTWTPASMKIYLDGQLLGEAPQSGAYHPPRISDWLTYGLKFGSDGGQPIKGTVDEAEFFNYELSAAQIAQEYDINPLAATPQTLTLAEDTVGTVQLQCTGGGTGAPVYQLQAPPQNGKVFLTGSTVTYYPNTHFTGTDTIAFKVTRGQQTSTASIPVQITPVDDALLVYVGGGQTVNLPFTANLSAAVSDIDTPAGQITSTWIKVSGPGEVTFANPAALATKASFSAPGDYVLRCIASDATSVRSDSLQVTVNAAGAIAPAVVILAPANATAFAFGTPIPMQATASVGGGATIAKVEFWEGSRKVGEAATPVGGVYQYHWTPSHLGVYALSFSATSSTGVRVFGGGLRTVRVTEGGWFTNGNLPSGNEGYSGTGGYGGTTSSPSSTGPGGAYGPGTGSNGGGGVAGAGGDGTGGDSYADDDGDGLANAVEHQLGTDQKKLDTDGDGLNDGDDAVPANPDMTVPAAPEASYVIIDLGTAASVGEGYGLDDQGEVLLVKPNPNPNPNYWRALLHRPAVEGRHAGGRGRWQSVFRPLERRQRLLRHARAGCDARPLQHRRLLHVCERDPAQEKARRGCRRRCGILPAIPVRPTAR
ncbi:MAG: LamG-like jellyroll fold domain-containing protein [Chthoniobacter sp.]